MQCRNKECQSDQAYIRQAEDSHNKEVFCPVCLFKEWLKTYNKKKRKNNDDFPNCCAVCDHNFDNGDVDLLKYGSTICHTCKYTEKGKEYLKDNN